MTQQNINYIFYNYSNYSIIYLFRIIKFVQILAQMTRKNATEILGFLILIFNKIFICKLLESLGLTHNRLSLQIMNNYYIKRESTYLKAKLYFWQKMSSNS
jgi:hypothetical protein